MGWLDATDDDLAVEKAMKIANRTSLPVIARSLTPAEVQLRSWRRIGLYALPFTPLALLMILAIRNDNSRERLELAITGLIFLLIGGLVARWWLRREGGYRDPQITVEVGADGVVVTSPGGVQGMRWGEIEAEVVHYRSRSGFTYCGIRMESPFGTIDLRDDRYRDGREAASVIVRGKVLAEETRQRAKIGIAEVVGE